MPAFPTVRQGMIMKINLDGLTEQELVALNREVVERIKMIRQLRTQVAMVEFRIGERVWFETDDGRTITGTVVRWNKKSVSIDSDCGHRWLVGPSFLRRVEPKDITPQPEQHQADLFLENE